MKTICFRTVGLFILSPISSFSLFAVRENERKVICLVAVFFKDRTSLTLFPVPVCTFQSIFPFKKSNEQTKKTPEWLPPAPFPPRFFPVLLFLLLRVFFLQNTVIQNLM